MHVKYLLLISQYLAHSLYPMPLPSRGKIAEWVLAELKLDYSTVLLDMRKGEHKQPSYLAINPWGKVPGLEDGANILG